MSLLASRCQGLDGFAIALLAYAVGGSLSRLFATSAYSAVFSVRWDVGKGIARSSSLKI